MTEPRWTTAQHKVVGAETDLIAFLEDGLPRSSERKAEFVSLLSALITSHIEAELTAQKRLEAYEAKQSSESILEPMPDYGDLIPIEDFDPNFLSPDDGTGYYATANGMSRVHISYEDIVDKTYDPKWTHVAWFNK